MGPVIGQQPIPLPQKSRKNKQKAV